MPSGLPPFLYPVTLTLPVGNPRQSCTGSVTGSVTALSRFTVASSPPIDGLSPGRPRDLEDGARARERPYRTSEFLGGEPTPDRVVNAPGREVDALEGLEHCGFTAVFLAEGLTLFDQPARAQG